MNSKLSERGNAVIIIVIVMALIIAAGMYLQAHNSGNDPVVQGWNTVSQVIDSVSIQQNCLVTTYTDGHTSKSCQ